MKKLLLSFAAACAVTAASAAVADLTKVWEKPVENAFKASDKVWNAPVAVDAAGNVIATGAFTEDLTIAGSKLEAVGTSAYVVKYDKTGEAAWAVAFSGAATVTAIDTDADGNIYIAGTFADEVTFGTTSGTPAVKEGMKVDEDPVTDQCASFLIKYDKNGVMSNIETFVPQVQPALLPLIGEYGEITYWYMDGDVRFYISEVKVVEGKVYVGATFSGVTKVGDKTFDAGYVTYQGWMYQDNLKATLLSLKADDFTNCEQLVLAGDAQETGAIVMDISSASSIKFDLEGNDMFVSVVAAGDIKFNDTDIPAEFVAGEYGENVAYVFINTLFTNGSQTAQSVTVANASTHSNNVSNVFIKDGKAIVVGKSGKTEVSTEGEGEDAKTVVKETRNIFVNTVAFANELTDNIKTIAIDPVDLYYSGISASAMLPAGEVYINFLDNEVAKSYVFANDAFAPATTVADAVGVASAGAYVAFSQIGETGAVFSLYNDSKATGIADIVADENAEAEYFNLQGVKVVKPENGLYIVRRGNTVTKELLR